jgi:hypothetical protein
MGVVRRSKTALIFFFGTHKGMAGSIINEEVPSLQLPPADETPRIAGALQVSPRTHSN